MWYKFAIKDTPWEDYLDLDKYFENKFEILIEWYDWASAYLSAEWLSELSKKCALNYPDICLIEQVEKPPETWLKTQIEYENACMEEHAKKAKFLYSLLKEE